MDQRNLYHGKKIIFFDSVCNLCNYFVNFCIERDPQFVLQFASLQSSTLVDIYKSLEENQNRSGLDHTDIASDDINKDPSTILFYEDGILYSKSQAVFQILKYLKGYIRLLRIFRFFPSFITDFFYNLVARYRYKIFGKAESCRVPQASEAMRFLN